MRGSIRQRSKGSWQIRIVLGKDKEDKQILYTETIRGNKSDAESRRAELLHQHYIGNLRQPTRKTLSEYLKEWTETSLKATVSERTYSDYKELCKRYIDNEIGHIQVNKLEPVHLQTFYKKLTDRGLSARTVRYVHFLLRKALKQAERWGLVMRNVTRLVDPPKQKRRKVMRSLDFDQAAKFLDAARFDTYYALWVLALDSAMRPEEYLALRWSDINFSKRKIHIERVVCRRRAAKRDKLPSYYFDDCKTPESHRSIIVAPSTIEVLQEWKIKQEVWKEKAGEKWQPLDLIFSNARGMPVHHSNLHRRHFKEILKRAGLSSSVRIYDLRHTCASLLGAMGHRVKEIQERLGHSSAKTTLDIYSHVLDSERAAPAKSFQKNLLFRLTPAVEGVEKNTKKRKIRK